ncbi:MAG: SAP domain-containing protein [Bacteroides sp.]|nr:SAP domain-containing protein [Eubacterium sp.]MCM1419381.1 SAP domain-containing protein [Roseburia sp.]MCM1463203.1 SAP domain-containing protein [Bacteroides sp.]
MAIFDFFKKKHNISADNKKIDPLDYFPNKYKIPPDTCEWGKGGENSIYSNARFLQWWSYPHMDLDKISYPMWMQYDCEIKDPKSKAKSLIKSGYLEECDLKSSLSSYLVEELKLILKSQNLPTNGKKQELIDRICESADLSLIKKPKVYTLSQKGKDYLEQYSEVLTAESFRAYDVSVEEYYLAKIKFPKETRPNDILWSIFNENIILYSKENKFGLLRNVYLSMAKYCENESRFAESERYYCAVLRYDLSGLGNGNTYSFSDVGLYPGIVKPIKKYKEYFNEEEILGFCEKLYLPRSITDFPTFKKILSDIFNDKLLTPEDYISKSKRPKDPVVDDGIWGMSDEEIRKLTDEIDEALGLNADIPFEEWLAGLKKTKDGKIRYIKSKK